jgi:hypothetical protein
MEHFIPHAYAERGTEPRLQRGIVKPSLPPHTKRTGVEVFFLLHLQWFA